MKLCVCVPISWNFVPKPFFFSFFGQFGAHRAPVFRAMGIDALEPLFSDAIPISHNRNCLAALALDKRADWTLWLDADMVHPPNLLERLLATAREHEALIVSASYWMKTSPHFPVYGYLHPDDPEHPIEPLDDGGKAGVYSVDYCGFGAVLVHSKVFKEIGTPCFYYDLDAGLNDAVSEDISFCRKARNSGFKILVNTAIECGHVREDLAARVEWDHWRDKVEGRCRVDVEPEKPTRPSAPPGGGGGINPALLHRRPPQLKEDKP